MSVLLWDEWGCFSHDSTWEVYDEGHLRQIRGNALISCRGTTHSLFHTLIIHSRQLLATYNPDQSLVEQYVHPDGDFHLPTDRCIYPTLLAMVDPSVSWCLTGGEARGLTYLIYSQQGERHMRNLNSTRDNITNNAVKIKIKAKLPEKKRKIQHSWW